MEMVKDRTLKKGQKVRVYVNLNKQGVFSIQDYKTGLVVGYSPSVLLKNCTFVIRKAGFEKARIEGVRNVHAFIVGYFEQADIERPAELNRKGFYCPFKTDTLVDEITGEAVGDMDTAYCFKKRVYFKEEEKICIPLFD